MSLARAGLGWFTAQRSAIRAESRGGVSTARGVVSTALPAKRARGFTLIELMVSLTLLATLAAAVVPMSETVARREREAQLRRALRDIRTALDAYQRDALAGHIEIGTGKSAYPASLSVLVDGVSEKPESARHSAVSNAQSRANGHGHSPADALRDSSSETPREEQVASPSQSSAEGGAESRRYYLRRLPRDPMCDCPDTAPADTWRLRPSDGGPDQWQGGSDIFDVSSASEATGLNGIRYDAW